MSAVIDVIRAVAVVVGVLDLLALAGMTWLPEAANSRAGDRDWLVALGVFCTYVVVQEAQQLGEPFVPWRLPFLLLGVAATARAIIRRLRGRRASR